MDPKDKESEKEVALVTQVALAVTEVGELLKNGDYQLALDRLSPSANLVPDNHNVTILLVECLTRVGRIELAQKKLSAMESDMSGLLEYYYLKALLEYYTGNLGQAKKLLMEVLKRDPDMLKCQMLMR